MTENNKDRQPMSRLEKFYTNMSEEEKKRKFPQTAKVMIQTGAAKAAELDFILGKYPELGKDWVEANPDVQSLMDGIKGRGSNRWLSFALVLTHNLTYDNIYRALKHSSLRPHMGDFTVGPNARPFFEDGRSVKVRAVESGGVDLTNIWKGHYIEQGFTEFGLDAPKYLENLRSKILAEQDIQKARALQGTYNFYCQVRDLSFPSLQPQLLDQMGQLPRDSSGNELFFPSNHQKAAIVKAGQEGSLAVFDGTGSGKTGIGIGLAEYIGAKRVLVVCPATVTGTWAYRIGKEYYKSNPGVVRIGSRNKKVVANGEMYTVVNYELLINRSSKGKKPEDILSPLSCRLLQSDFDLLIMDEAHYINNPNGRSEAVVELARRIDRKLILTATPIRNSVDDLSRIAYLLSPNEFTTPNALRELGESGVPSLVELLATKTIRRRTEDLVELPPFCPENNGEIDYLQLKLNPTQQAVYDIILDDSSLDPFSKLRLIRLAAIDHNLVRGGKYKLPFEEQQASKELQRAYKSWKKQQERGTNILFNSDFLVTHGYKHLFVGIHLQYRKGMDYFIQKYGDKEIKEVWEGVVESTKFKKIAELVKQKLAKGKKVVIFSGHFVKGVLREMIDDVSGEAIEEDLYSYLKKEFPEVMIGRIDGGVSPTEGKKKTSKRDIERQKWQNDPNYKILLTSVPSSSLGIDLTVNDGVTKGIDIIGIDFPYTHTDFWQMISRVYRFRQKDPVNIQILKALGTIDQGLHTLIDKKENIAQLLFDGVSADEIERQIFDRSKTRSNLVEYITSPRKEMERMFHAMRGQGVTANGTELQKVLKDGKTFGETIAELYSKYWEYTYSGHAARVLQQVIDGLRAAPNSKMNLIVDAGSGPLILERTMRQESDFAEGLKVISVDINKYMLENGLVELQRLGYQINRSNILNRPMSDTRLIGEICDAVVCSLAFHYSNSAEDRGKILAEANRILRPGGYYFVTLPEGYLTPEQYKSFGKALKKFGFEIDKTISGQAKAIDHKDVPFTIWLIAARKIGDPAGDSLTMEEFRFNFEGPKISRYKGGKDSGADDSRDKKTEGQDRLVKHEKFLILDPDNNFQAKGSLTEVLSRLGLDLDEEKLKRQGWKMEVRRTKDGAKTFFKK